MATATVRDPATMTPGEINRELDSLATRSEAATDAMIEAGRGHWKNSSIMIHAEDGDALCIDYVAISNRQRALHTEIELRYGPGAPHRLPRGFKRRRVV